MTADLQRAALTARERVLEWSPLERHRDAYRAFTERIDALCEAYRALGRAEYRDELEARREAIRAEWLRHQSDYLTAWHLATGTPAEPATYGQGEGGRDG